MGKVMTQKIVASKESEKHIDSIWYRTGKLTIRPRKQASNINITQTGEKSETNRSGKSRNVHRLHASIFDLNIEGNTHHQDTDFSMDSSPTREETRMG